MKKVFDANVGIKIMGMSPEELESLAQEGVKLAIARMHSQGVPSIAVVDGKMYEQHPDGKMVPIPSKKD
ncbi:hypothetical protein [Merismopedia glauca]|nr:hypothetical protein [Merismopedia glauca]